MTSSNRNGQRYESLLHSVRRLPLAAWMMALPLLFVLLICAPSKAQTRTPASDSSGEPAATPAASRSLKAKTVNGVLVYLPETVKQSVLEELQYQVIEVHGNISSYTGVKQRFTFAMDDGSYVTVIGDYPAMGHTRWTMRARVIDDAGVPALAEVAKCQGNSCEIASSNTPAKVDTNVILMGVGALLLVGAAALMGMLSLKNKVAEEKKRLGAMLDDERSRTEREKARAEELQREVNQLRNTGSAGKTVALNAAQMAVIRGGMSAPPVSLGILSVTAGPNVGESYQLTNAESLIGREGPNLTAKLDKDNTVSALHATVTFTADNRAVYEDKSRTGSTVDGVFVHRTAQELHSGSVLRVGATTLLLEISQLAAPVATDFRAASPAPVGPAPQATQVVETLTMAAAGEVDGADKSDRELETQVVSTLPAAAVVSTPTVENVKAELEVTAGPDQKRRFPLTRDVVTLGRSGSDILLTDNSVSRSHATLRWYDGQFFLCDENSSHGTRVNGEVVSPEGRALSDGDSIEFGKSTQVTYHCI